MAGHLHETHLYGGPNVSVQDVRCRPHDASCGGAERSQTLTLAFIRRGVFRIHVDREILIADVNHAVLFGSGDEYRVSHPVSGGDDCTSFTFSDRLACDALRRLGAAWRGPLRSRSSMRRIPLTSSAAWAAAALRRNLCHGNDDPMFVEEISVALLAAAVGTIAFRDPVASLERSETRATHRAHVDRVRLLLAAHFREPLTLVDVSVAIACSPYHLARLFRRETGTPLHRYLNRLRLRSALHELADGRNDLTALAFELGYSSHSHFSHAFHREFGAPPSTVRGTLTRERLREMSKKLTA